MRVKKLLLWSICDNNARYNSRYERVSGDLIRLRNRSKLVERSLFAIIDLLQRAKSIVLYFIWRVWGLFYVVYVITAP